MSWKTPSLKEYAKQIIKDYWCRDILVGGEYALQDGTEWNFCTIGALAYETMNPDQQSEVIEYGLDAECHSWVAEEFGLTGDECEILIRANDRTFAMLKKYTQEGGINPGPDVVTAVHKAIDEIPLK